MYEKIPALLKKVPQYAKLALRLARHQELTLKEKSILAGGLLYWASPIDFIPGVIPALGQLDDLIVALSSLNYALKKLPPDIRKQELLAVGLEEGEIEEDIRYLKALAREIAGQTLNFSVKTLSFAGRQATKLMIKGTGFLVRKLIKWSQG
ncbi:YkvA family protein [Carboxydothermus pertinax]|uniref:DUF1232 domain-containing protein n=1 Tax=Carboxydothermus pertinax TaxID=870242 RepID=A0A1L8CVD8_9THEO|nr:YkvA family protein [Carboxydothermus pertinax]GAV22873.1 hypothetical protein cpu_13830 [Carboxydothermus pertinax]